MNGLVITGLMIAFVSGGALYAIGNRQLPYNMPFALGTYLAAVIAMGVWLNKERERRYAALYKTMPITIRCVFGLAVLALLTWGFGRSQSRDMVQ